MIKVIINDTIEAFNQEVGNLKKILFLEEVSKYFNHCAEFGIMRAENNCDQFFNSFQLIK